MNINDFNMLSPDQVSLEMTKAKSDHRNYFEFRHMVRSGEIKEVEVYSYPITIGQKVFLFSIIIDVTVANEREREVEAHEDLIRQNTYLALVCLLLIIICIIYLLVRNTISRNKLKYMTHHDMLTGGLLNRVSIVENYDKLIKQGLLPMALIVIDIDHLKFINDTFGHQEGGDFVICEVAKVLKDVALDKGYAYRISGDEFVVYMPHVARTVILRLAIE